MSYEMKQEIQKMVSTALKPYYNRKELSKEKYTEINREVSRMLYDKVWEGGGLTHPSTRQRWQKVAANEVAQAVTVSASAPTSAPATNGTNTPNPGASTSSVLEKAAPASPTTEVAIRPAVKV
jgi:hypothetical protein